MLDELRCCCRRSLVHLNDSRAFCSFQGLLSLARQLVAAEVAEFWISVCWARNFSQVFYWMVRKDA